MRFPRMTTRRWMIAVAGFGVLLFGLRVFVSSRNYRILAELHAAREASYWVRAEQAANRRDWAAQQVELAGSSSSSDRWKRTVSALEPVVLDMRRRAAHESQLKRKYRQAAARPWRSVPPE
jgi:hypothetical protein